MIIFMCGLVSCHHEHARKKPPTSHSSPIAVDHVNIWVEHPDRAKEKLTQIGFASVPDSLSEVHRGQGTSGRYFHFLNSYLELIFVEDTTEFKQNARTNEQLDFIERSNFKKNGASPFSVALKLKKYIPENIPFSTVQYHQEWMGEKQCIYSAKASKEYLKEPSIFVVYPEIESEQFDQLSDVERIPEAYAFARDFYKHPNGAQKLTKILIHAPKAKSRSKAFEAINKLESLEFKNGGKYVMELHFDENRQGKTFDLRPDLPLIIHL